MRFFIVMGSPSAIRHAEVPWWGVLGFWLITAVPLALYAGKWASEHRSPLTEIAVEEARWQARREARQATADDWQQMVPLLADAHFQALQFELQSDRLATLLGLPHEQRTASYPEDSSLLQIAHPTAEKVLSEMDFITRLLELKHDEISMVELSIIRQRLSEIPVPNFVLPVSAQARVSSGFGWRTDPFTGHRALHKGLDFQGAEGTPVLAMADGLVTRVEALPDYGNLVQIAHRDGLASRYAHLSQALVRPGQAVRRGEEIARMGNTGRSTGPHLHFEIMEFEVPQNPLTFFLRHDVMPQKVAGRR